MATTIKGALSELLALEEALAAWEHTLAGRRTRSALLAQAADDNIETSEEPAEAWDGSDLFGGDL